MHAWRTCRATAQREPSSPSRWPSGIRCANQASVRGDSSEAEVSRDEPPSVRRQRVESLRRRRRVKRCSPSSRSRAGPGFRGRQRLAPLSRPQEVGCEAASRTASTCSRAASATARRPGGEIVSSHRWNRNRTRGQHDAERGRIRQPAILVRVPGVAGYGTFSRLLRQSWCRCYADQDEKDGHSHLTPPRLRPFGPRIADLCFDIHRSGVYLSLAPWRFSCRIDFFESWAP